MQEKKIRTEPAQRTKNQHEEGAQKKEEKRNMLGRSVANGDKGVYDQPLKRGGETRKKGQSRTKSGETKGEKGQTA